MNDSSEGLDIMPRQFEDNAQSSCRCLIPNGEGETLDINSIDDQASTKKLVALQVDLNATPADEISEQRSAPQHQNILHVIHTLPQRFAPVKPYSPTSAIHHRMTRRGIF
jgi:hypothetical protein